MNSPDIIDATAVDPVLGSYRPVDQRTRSNMYDMWTEYLCVRDLADRGFCLATCVFGALAEPPEQWFDEDGEPLPHRCLKGTLFPPAFYDSTFVSEVGSFICGPLTLSPGGDEILIGAFEDERVADALAKLEWPTGTDLHAKVLRAASAQPRSSKLPENILSAYLDTEYTADASDQTICLEIGKPSPSLSALLKSSSTTTAAFLTAWNPRGEPSPDEDNRQRNLLLQEDLIQVSREVLSGQGAGHDPCWPPEASFLATGLTFEEAVHAGRHYQQNAIVWSAGDSVPKLVLLR